MSIQELLDKVSEEGVSLWDMKKYSLSIRDKEGNVYEIVDFKLDTDNKKIKIKVE